MGQVKILEMGRLSVAGFFFYLFPSICHLFISYSSTTICMLLSIIYIFGTVQISKRRLVVEEVYIRYLFTLDLLPSACPYLLPTCLGRREFIEGEIVSRRSLSFATYLYLFSIYLLYLLSTYCTLFGVFCYPHVWDGVNLSTVGSKVRRFCFQ